MRSLPSTDTTRIQADIEAATLERIDAHGKQEQQSRGVPQALISLATCCLLFVTFACGIAGLAYLVVGMSEIICDIAFVIGMGSLICLPACAVYAFFPRATGTVILICFVGSLAALLINWSDATAQAAAVFGYITDQIPMSKVGDITLLCSVIALLAGCILTSLTLLAHVGWSLAILCVPLLVLCPFVGYAPDVACIALLLGYHAGTLSFALATSHANRIRPVITLLVALLVALAVALSAAFVERFPETASAPARGAEVVADAAVEAAQSVAETVSNAAQTVADAVVDAARDIGSSLEDFFDNFGGSSSYSDDTTTTPTSSVSSSDLETLLGSNGEVNRGDLGDIDGTVLEVTTSEQPQSILYLPYFSGGSYSGGVWSAADESAFIELEVERGISATLTSERLTSAGYQMAAAFGEDVLPRLSVTLTAATSALDIDEVRPYAALSLGSDDADEAYYEAVDIGYYDSLCSKGINLALQPELDGDLTAMLSDYSAWVASVYTDVPLDELPRLSALVAENPLSDLDEITAFIQTYLAENAIYTTEPGTFPDDVDIAEYLLFEGHEGYCQHFATAAVLMYRLYGVPARYVTGFAVPSFAFTEQDDGTWSAPADSARAHAWVEIYTEALGWIPVEVTPSDSDAAPWTMTRSDTSAMQASAELSDEQSAEPEEEPGGDEGADEAATGTASTDRQNQQSVPPTGSSESTPPTGTSDDSSSDEGSENTSVDDVNTTSYETRSLRPWVIAVICIAAALVLALVITVIALRRRRQRIRTRRTHLRADALFADMLAVLHRGDMLMGYGGTEQDIAEKLTEAVPAISADEAQRFVDEADRAAYGPPDGTQGVADARSVADYYAAAEQVRSGLGPFGRLGFRYIHGLD